MRAVAHWQCLPDRLEALGSIPSSEKKKWGWGYGKCLRQGLGNGRVQARVYWRDSGWVLGSGHSRDGRPAWRRSVGK